MARLFNYSALNDEEDKIYALGGTKISSTGISLLSIKVIGSIASIGIIQFILICVLTKKQYWNPLTDWRWPVFILTIGLWLGIGCILFYVRISTYRLYQWLYGRLKPKYIYNNEGLFSNNRQKYVNYTVEGPIKKIL